MTDDPRPTTEISLLGRNYVIACPSEERVQLERAALYLDRSMRSIHAQGKILGTEKIAVMAALNITHELVKLLEERKSDEESLGRLNARLEDALVNAPQR
ncbi:cell division protein ZapA [Pistricoccus aurantiacus]|uniref:Cell division protein ZapA n=1 Tax=Pistricoccus aurantiacus TaxID=1883414 RepID=A0A5B8SMR1_9GAMM|nr:cell division protein ZapA [Pistricoccus aurantiacus]QEA38389.1 cell division protein ZapA [Pistricoccus aurantiacus]